MLALVLAWVVDLAFGEPRNRLHPVAWFGSLMSRAGRGLPQLPPTAAFVGGALLWLIAIAVVVVLALGLQHWVQGLPWWASAPLLALALKPALAWRMLVDEVRAVESALDQGLEAGRARLAFLCSRDVSAFDAVQVRETAIESLAENFNDSLVAPLFWFVVAGLPGAWAWRAANTLDAMWGYRGRWEWAGKWAARADDLLGWIPARIAGVLLWRPDIDLGTLRREARLTASPNGGWPMASLALRLGLRLGKPGVYVLNGSGRAPDAASIAAAVQSGSQAAWFAVVLAVVALGLTGYARG